MLILGKREVEEGVVAVRHRIEGDIGTMTTTEFVELIDSQQPE
jgi:threonyl-tRNA synthetase